MRFFGSPALRIALAVSLALNVLVIAAFAGGWARRHFDDDAGRASAGHMMRGEARDRGEAGAVRSEHRPAIEAARGAVGRARAQVAAAVTAQPFDPGALTAALQGLRAAEAALAETRHAMFEALVAQASAERRAAFAERLLRADDRRRGHAGRDGD
jgi:uncharacterized membrane protein